MSIADRVGAVRDRVAEAATRSGRDVGDITIVAVAKFQPVEALLDAAGAGLRVFGESRSDELVVHREALGDDTEWHFVGTLQRNKAREVRARVSLLHSLDRPALVEAWVKGPGLPPPVLVQVNLADESQKGGVPVGGVEPLIEHARAHGLEVRGLMAVPPRSDHPDDARRWCARLRQLRDRLERSVGPLPELSMGMSADYEVAVEEGSTLIRLGTTIFGARAQR